MRVLITGAAGFVGQRVAAALRPRHQLVLGDIRPENGPEWRELDVRDMAQVETALAGVDAVLHLAIASGREGEYEDDAFNDLRYQVNVLGTGHVLAAAARNGIRRVVHTSSIMVVWGYGPGEYVGPDAAPRPVGTYALTKYLGEEIARYYAHPPLSVVCLRIAKPIDLEDAELRSRPARPQWIPFPDLCRLYELALTAPLSGFHVIHAVGETHLRRWDLSAAETLLGYRPEHRLDELGYTLDENAPILPPRQVADSPSAV
ncbi:MAG: NAD(P)-dependent oxidoreductase [Armatimonadetes bacterium]|nr:NAD(P)-dependent oxidoreductase [Armatimonadota bacterium]